MLSELIDFVTELFPSINPYTKDKVKSAIRQFEISSGGKTPSRNIDYLTNQPFDYLTQGDIISNLPFVRYNSKTGVRGLLVTEGILLSNTCDAVRDPALVFAPLIELSNFTNEQQEQIKKNEIYRLLYLPDGKISNKVIDFSMVNSLPRVMIVEGLKKAYMTKNSSLNRYGYYLFLVKLTVHFMRPEDAEAQISRGIV
ncbi:hypothetical protein [Paenibacillus kandeliae]|uniref:hypothetical protein n=1 Tax=Paenibacillus kandeliae TaxID=3231269 RepID=UPI0034586C75